MSQTKTKLTEEEHIYNIYNDEFHKDLFNGTSFCVSHSINCEHCFAHEPNA